MIVFIQLIQSFISSVAALMTLEAGLTAANVWQTDYANSKVRLYQGPGQIAINTPKATLVAGEATYEGYTAGGNLIAAWGAPLAVTPSGWAINAETTFAYVDAAPHTGNTITGGWVEAADGEVLFAFNLPTPVNFTQNGNGFVCQLQSVFGRGS